MCAPAVIGLIGSGLSMAGQAKQGSFNQAQAEQNAKLAAMQAGDAKVRDAMDARKIALEAHQIQAANTASAAAGNVEQRSVANAWTGYNAMVDAARVRANAAREAWGYSTHAMQYHVQGGYDRTASYMGMASTGLSAAGNFMATYARS